MQKLTVEAKAAQLLMFGFPGTEVSPFLKDFILQNGLGGVIHFARNVKNPSQLAALNHELQSIARESPNGIGLLIAADQEGGTVVRLTEGVAVPPSAMALGAAGSKSITERICSLSGFDLAATGINMVFAPVLDVNSNPLNPVIGVRSFGENPARVAEHGSAAIRGFQRYVAAVAKHFPGHGDTELDSHLALPAVQHGRQRLAEVELLPFRKAIAKNVSGIMTAHVVFPAIEPTPGLPATLSYRVLTGLLRDELGYEGLILTDCMEMAAISETFGTVEAAVMAVEAGADLILISQTEARQRGAFEAIVAAVKSGRIPEERLDQSLERILKVKHMLLSRAQPPLDLVGSREHIEIVRKAINRSITVVQDQGSLPIREGTRILVVEPIKTAANIAEDRLVNVGTLAAALLGQGLTNLEQMTVTAQVSPEEHRAVLAKAQGFDMVVVVTSDAHRQKGQAGLVRALIDAGRRVIAVGARTPYELAAFPDVPTYVAAYGSRPMVWDETAKVLVGKSRAAGRLPVTIPTALK